MSERRVFLETIAVDAPAVADLVAKPENFIVIDGLGTVSRYKEYDSPLSVYLTGTFQPKSRKFNVDSIQDGMRDFQGKLKQYHETDAEECVGEIKNKSQLLFELVSGIGQIAINFPNIFTAPRNLRTDDKIVTGGLLFPVLDIPEFKSHMTTYQLGVSGSGDTVDFQYLRFNAAPTVELYIPQ